ncbi:MAG: tetratricopeptide repeat protein [Chlorogloeopsis fritschii C42_A2020_084]|uniref:ATP-binding protein n=1 Tax=Chlorogloeopsis fritschii TaxID=1124 RepID=UPI0019FCE034|nr:ATP-binding protein [Chlorogloeopsis fritschii]MBF2006916.1 tetratricopeptide repeat protein [Chlorogloeopsis fritschii C42_A2020_084]
MTDDYVNSPLSLSDREVVLQAINTIRERLPLLLDITEPECKYLPEFESKNQELVTKALEVAMQNPNFVSCSNPPQKRQTLQQILKQRQQLSFVGREEEITLFRQNIELPFADHQHRFIFNVFGQGGVGKTSLLRQFRQIAENAKFLTAYTNEMETSILAVIAHLAQQLEQQGYKLTKFNECYQLYQHKQQELASDVNAPQGFSAFLKGAGKTGDIYLKLQIPRTTVVLDYVDKDIEATQTEWATYLAKKIYNQAERRLLQEPVAVLTPLFLEDLWQLGENSHLALFFDTYDRTEAFLDLWLREILDGCYGDVPPNILLVIAGRQELNQNYWTCYEGSIMRLGLEPFTESEARQYLIHKGINNTQTIDVIIHLSERLPLLVATLAAQAPQDPSLVGDVNGLVIERFLKWAKETKQRQGVVSAAIPRYLNREVLVQLRGEQEADELLAWLKQMPFMETRSHGLEFHDAARTLILRYKRLTSAQAWADLQGKLADYYDSLANNLQLDEQKKWCNSTWQNHKLNVLYHRLCQSTQKNLPLALNGFLAAVQHKYNFALAWAETIIQVGRDTDALEVQRWGEKLLKGLKAFKEEDYETTIEMLTALIDQGKLDAKWRALAFSFRGAIYYVTKRQEEALKNFKQATALDSTVHLANLLRGCIYAERERYSEAIKNFDQIIFYEPLNIHAIAQRGYTYHLMKHYQEAIQDFDRAIAIDSNYTWGRIQRGYNNLLMQRYEEAIQDFDCVVEIDSQQNGAKPGGKSLRAYALRGIGYYLLERYAQALQDFDRFLALEPDDIKVILLRGTAYYLQERYDEAVQDLNHVLKLKPEQTQALVLRGAAYKLMEYHVEAVLDFDRVIQLEPTNKWAIVQRGQTYRRIEDYAKAVQDFDLAIALDTYDIEAIIKRGETYQLMGNYDKALKDFNRAISLNPNNTWAIVSRGEIYQLMRQYEEALQDFERAIELDPNCTQAISSRGKTYQLMGHYDQALKEFKRAIEFKPQDTWLIACRGETYQLIGNYSKALNDFNHALSLDPNYTWAMVCRGETYQLMGRYEQALTEFNHALELDLMNDKALAARGYTYWMMNSYAEALKDFDRAIELNSNNSKAWVGRGYTYRAINRYTAALKDFERALEIDKNNGWALTGRGATYCRMENYNEALSDFDRALKLNSNQHYESALAGRGYTYLLLKRYQEALADLDRAIQLNAQDDWYMYLRALTYQTLNEASKARTDLASAIKLAKERYQNNPQDWRNTFNLALYYLAVQYYPTVENLYRYAISKGASLEQIREAIHDLDNFLTIFPEHLQAKFMRQLLQSAFN